MNKIELIKYIDEYLKIKDFEDGSKNWLQVDSEKIEINKIWFAVDAASYIFDKSINEKIDLLIVHHGLFWSFQWSLTLTWSHYERVAKLIKNDICLYWAHLPLDADDKVGNNIWIIKSFIEFFALKNFEIEKFGEYHGVTIWYWIRFNDAIEIGKLKDFCEKEKFVFEFYNFWNLSEINSFCIMSWWCWEDIPQAKDKWYDVFLIWEAAHYEISLAKDLKQSVILGWHYETETVWVKLLAKHLEERFGIETVFIDEKY